MLKFRVFQHDDDGSTAAAEFPLFHAHLLGNEDIGMQGEITFADGLINCDKRSIDPAGLALLVDAGPCGSLVLRTCLLPDREEPYLLHVELARHRIKMFIVKQEDWMLCGMDADHPIMQAWREARDLLTAALTIQHLKPEEADRLGYDALLRGIEATEEFATMHADLLLAKRFNAGTMPKRALGCQVHQSKFADPLARTMQQQFDFLSIPIRWRELEPEEGKYDWSQFDKWMEWAAKTGYPVVAGPLIDFRPLSVPEWLYVWEHDYDTTHDLLHEHIESIVQRYRKVVTVWNVASALHINQNFTLAYDQLMDLIRMSTSLVKSLDSKSRTMIEIADPFGEYFASNPTSIPPIVFAETVAQSGFKTDMLGLALQIGHHAMGRGTRDLMQISSVLDELLHVEMPVVVSAVSAPSFRKANGEVDPAGFWREEWTPESQAEFLAKATSIALSKSFVQSVCVHELYDHSTTDVPRSGLITSTGRAKPALARLAETYRDLQSGKLRCSTPEERRWNETEYREEADFAG